MVTVKDILNFIETIAPSYMKEDWDNVGLNCGRMDKEVKTVLVALDPFMHVCEEAKEVGAQLLLTHHALIWEPGFVNDQTQWGKCALYLIENGIAHVNAHTNLDCAPGGVNDQLAAKLCLADVSILHPQGPDDLGRTWGLIRMGQVEAQQFADVAVVFDDQNGFLHKITPRISYGTGMVYPWISFTFIIRAVGRFCIKNL